MNKITLEIGYKTGRRRKVAFTGEALEGHTFLDEPGRDSRGTHETLYRVKGGFRVETCQWSHWQGEEEENYTSLSEILTEADLLAQYTTLANDNGIYESADLDSDPTALDA